VLNGRNHTWQRVHAIDGYIDGHNHMNCCVQHLTACYVRGDTTQSCRCRCNLDTFDSAAYVALSCVQLCAGALIVVSLTGLLYGGMHNTSGAWQLATKAGGSREWAAHGQRPDAFGRPATHQVSTMNNVALFTAAVEQRHACGTADGNGHGYLQPMPQQAIHPAGQHQKLPATNDLDHLLLEGRFGVDSRRGQLAFEWSHSTIRCSNYGFMLPGDP
jgi:hypothetical protein